MSSGAMREIGGYLRSCSAVTAIAPQSEIRFGWPDELEKFPCIILTQVAGSDTGYLGSNVFNICHLLRPIFFEFFDRFG